MERIASFQVDHNKLVPGMYLSRRDGNVTMEYLLRKLGIGGGYEATMIRNEMIEELIQFHPYSAAE